MTVSKRFGIVLLAGAIGLFGLALGERLIRTRYPQLCLFCGGDCWASANPRECCWGCAADGTAMRCWSVLLLR